MAFLLPDLQCGYMIDPTAKVFEQVNRTCLSRNMISQLLTAYTNSEPSNYLSLKFHVKNESY